MNSASDPGPTDARQTPQGTVARMLRDVAAQTSSLLVPRLCPCGREGSWLCPACRDLLRVVPLRVESCCDALQNLSAARVRERSPSLPAGVDHRPLLPVLALGEYTGDLQRLVLSWKNGGMLHLGGPIARGLAPAVGQLMNQGPNAARRAPPWLVPVPSRLRARLRRGEDHTAELVRSLARVGAGTPLLLRATPTSGQEGQGARQRRTRRIRLAGPLPASARAGSAGCVIVDDVVTTGATLRGMHEALTAAGLQVVGAVVVASARVPAASLPVELRLAPPAVHGLDGAR